MQFEIYHAASDLSVGSLAQINSLSLFECVYFCYCVIVVLCYCVFFVFWGGLIDCFVLFHRYIIWKELKNNQVYS